MLEVIGFEFKGFISKLNGFVYLVFRFGMGFYSSENSI